MGPSASQKETSPVCRSVLASGSLWGERQEGDKEGIGVALDCCGVSSGAQLKSPWDIRRKRAPVLRSFGKWRSWGFAPGLCEFVRASALQ